MTCSFEFPRKYDMMFLTAVGMIVLGCASCAAEPGKANPQDGAVHVICHGRLLQGVVAIGGETTGTTVSFDGMTWELKLSDEVRRQIEKEEHRQVTVEGRLRRVAGVAIPVRWIVDVEKLTKRDSKAPKPKAEFTFTGRFSPVMGKALPQSFEVAGETWPVAWGNETDLPAKAMALAGKPVIAQGTAEANTEGGPKKYPIFHIRQLREWEASASK